MGDGHRGKSVTAKGRGRPRHVFRTSLLSDVPRPDAARPERAATYQSRLQVPTTVLFTVSFEVSEFHTVDRGSVRSGCSNGRLGHASLRRLSAVHVRVARKSDRTYVKPKIVCKILLQNESYIVEGVENDHDRADAFGLRSSGSRHAWALGQCTACMNTSAPGSSSNDLG